MVEGRYADAQRSAVQTATLEASAEHWQLHLPGRVLSVDAAQLRISERIANIPRRIGFPDGAEFETSDNDGIDALLRTSRGSGAWIHALERRWIVAAGALVWIVIISVLFLRFGIPAAANWAAQRLPPSADRLLGGQSLELLDSTVFDASALDAQRQAQLQNLFAAHDPHAGRWTRLPSRTAPSRPARRECPGSALRNHRRDR